MTSQSEIKIPNGKWRVTALRSALFSAREGKLPPWRVTITEKTRNSFFHVITGRALVLWIGKGFLKLFCVGAYE